MITASTFCAPNWVDLATPDVGAATGFYGELFGWEVEKTASPMGDYYIGHAHGQRVAGMMRGHEDLGDLAMWTVFVYVEDIDETARRLEAAGGRLIQSSSHTSFDLAELVPDAAEGRVAVAVDSTGAMFGLVAGPAPEGAWFSRDPGAVSWVEIVTRDPEASESFYAAVFGWTAAARGDDGTPYTTFMLQSEPVAGMLMMPDSVPAGVPAYWSIYFTVDDCDASVERLIQLGGKPLGSIIDVDEGRFVVVQDPQGAVFQLMEHRRQVQR